MIFNQENLRYFHWFYGKNSNRFLFGVSLSLFFWLFLSFAQPFGIHSNDLTGFLTLTIWLLPISSLWLLSFYLIDFALPKKGYTKVSSERILGEWSLKIFLAVHLIFSIRGFSCSWTCLDLFEYLQLWIGCLVIFLIVFIPFLIYARLQFFKRTFSNQKEGSEFEESGKGKSYPGISNLDEVIYFKSDDNYIDAFFSKGGEELTSSTQRMTMKSLVDDLSFSPKFIRTHRSYVVNLNYYSAEHTNLSQGHLGLVLENGKSIEIPVSRKYKANILALIQ